MFCANVFDAKSTRVHLRRDDFAVMHTCCDFSKCARHSAESIDAVVQRLREGSATMKKGAFVELEKALGFTYAPEAILFDDFLRPMITPPASAIYDWMHVFFVGGCVNHHLGHFMWAVRGTRFSYSFVHAYMQLWSWPHAVGYSTGVDAFSPARAKASLEARVLKMTASEGRSILPVFAHLVRRTFIEQPGMEEFVPHAEAIGKLASILWELEAAARGTANLARLQDALDSHIGCFVRSPHPLQCMWGRTGPLQRASARVRGVHGRGGIGVGVSIYGGAGEEHSS